MLEQTHTTANYGYCMPVELINMNWKKYFDNQNTDKQAVFDLIVKIRQYLAQNTEVNHLIKEVLATEVHKQLFKYAKKTFQRILSGEGTQIDVQSLHEIIWIFTNLCSGQKKSTTEILELGIVNLCKQLFALQNFGQIIGILFELIGNLAGELTDPKFYLFMSSKYINYVSQETFHCNSSWAFSNLFRDYDSCEDKCSFDKFEEIILGYYPIINQLLQIDNQEAIINILYIFYYISKIESFHFLETMQIVEKYINDLRPKVSHLAIQIVGNYIAQCDQAVDFALNHPHFLSVVFSFLKSPQKMKQRKQSAWIISNIFAGTVNQVDKFVSIPTLFNELYSILIIEQNESVIREFIWSISNSFTSCSEKSFETIFYSSIIQPLSAKMQACKEKASYSVYLEGITFYLKKFQQIPNLDFRIFMRNLEWIQAAISHAQFQYSNFANIALKINMIRQSIQKLRQRGPITEEQMAKHHLQKFSI